jgi:hypothetical protein
MPQGVQGQCRIKRYCFDMLSILRADNITCRHHDHRLMYGDWPLGQRKSNVLGVPDQYECAT